MTEQPLFSRDEWPFTVPSESLGCFNVHPDIFYEEQPHFVTAKQICAQCPYTVECLEQALKIGDIFYGFRAGMNATQRKAAARKRPTKN